MGFLNRLLGAPKKEERELPRDVAQRVVDEIKMTSRKALKDVWKIKNALGVFDVYLCSKCIYEISKSLVKVGLVEEIEVAIQEAFKVIPRFKEGEPDSLLEPLQFVCRTLLVTGRSEEALRVARDVRSVAGVTDEDGILVRVLSRDLGEAGEFEKALNITEEISGKKQYPYALSDICKALARAGQINRALEVAEGIADEPPLSDRAFTLGEVCEILCEVGQGEAALSIARAISKESPSFRQSALFNVAEDFAKRGQIDDARATAKEALDITYKDQSWSLYRASEVLAQAGEIEEALETARKIDKRKWYSYALRAVCRALAESGQVEEALNIARGLDDKAERSEALSLISQALAEAGRISEAQEIAYKISDDDKRSEALASVSRSLARGGKVNEALKIVQKLPEEYAYRGIDTFDTLVKTLTQTGRIDEAMGIARMYDSTLRVGALAEIYCLIRTSKEGT